VTHYYDRDSIHARRATSVIFGLVMKSFTVMTWTTKATHGSRDMSVRARLDFRVTHYYDRDSIHA
jgi:hypothetical protein